MNKIWRGLNHIFEIAAAPSTIAPWRSIFIPERIASTYASRQADTGWKAAIRRIVDPSGKRVADIGCGGGIYSRAWHELGARTRHGRRLLRSDGRCRTRAGGRARRHLLPAGRCRRDRPAAASADIVFQRALIHHLQDYTAVLRRSPPRAHPGRSLDRAGPHAGRRATARLRRAPARLFLRMLSRDCWRSKQARRPTDTAVRAALDAAGFARSRRPCFGKCARSMTTGKG